MKIFTTTDNAQGQLDASINASDLVIVLGSGEGDLLPNTINGSATSSGDKNTLNSTGILALGVSVGDLIENVTDGSVATIKSVSTNSIVTTDLRGGSGNTWDNTDVWAINRFVVTLEKRTTNASGVVTVTAREKVLIEDRALASDNLNVNSSGRGFDGSSAQSFSATDYCVLHSISLHHENLKEFIGEQSQIVKDLQDNKADTSLVQALLDARSWKDKVKVASTGDLDLSNEVEDGDTIDGVVIATDDRVLIKDQSTDSENGIYIVQASGAAVRAADFNTSDEATSAAVSVTEGTLNADTSWFCTSDEPIIDTDPIVFIKLHPVPLVISKTLTAGESVDGTTTPQAVYISDGTGGRTVGRYYKADANDATNTDASKFFGFAKESKTAGETDVIFYTNIVDGFTGLTVGADYFLSDTAGAIATTPGTIEVKIGRAISATEIQIKDTTSSFSGGVTTEVSSTTQNVDNTFECGFRPNVIEIGFELEGKDNGAATYSAGTATYQGTTIKSNFYLYKNHTATNDLIVDIEATNPTVGASGGLYMIVTLSILSISDTNFVVRTSFSENGGASFTAKFTAKAFK